MQRIDRRDEDGFTLVELMVVVAIIGILVAVAVLSYGTAQRGARKAVASSNLKTALTSARTLHAEEETYLVTDVPATVSKLETYEPALEWQTAPATAAEQISVTSDTDTAAMATRASDGHCYYVLDDVGTVDPGTLYGKSTTAAASCAPEADTTAPGIDWAETPKLAGW